MSKLKFKQNSFIIIFNLIIILLFLIQFFCFYIIENGHENIVLNRQYHNACKEFINANENEKIEIQHKYELQAFTLENDVCEKIASFEHPSPSAEKVFKNILIDNNFASLFFPYFVPLLILFPFIYKLSKEFRSSQVKNYILRDDYKNYVKKIFKQAYSNIWLIPLLICIVALVSYVICGHIDPSSDIYLNYINLSKDLALNPLFYIYYLLIILLNFGLYTNIGLMVLYKNKNFIVSLIESFLLVYFVWSFNEVFVISKLGNLLKVNPLHFSLLNIYTWNSITSINIYFFFNFIIYFLSLLIVIKLYKNKENFVHNCER